MLVLPLKVPHPYELEPALTAWLEHSEAEFSSEECREDLVRLASLRRSVTNVITHPNGHAAAMGAVDDCHEYHAALLQCETRGLTGVVSEEDEGLRLEWDGAFARETSNSHSSLMWERACLMWDMCAFETYSASNQDNSRKAGIQASIGHLTMAASLFKHLKAHVEKNELFNTAVDLSKPMLSFWENAMVAQAQMETYELAQVGKAKPPHPLLAKLAIATVPVLNDCLKLCQDPLLTSQLPAQTQDWGAYCKAYSIWFKGKAEYHESCASRAKSQWGTELARLRRANGIIIECQRFVATMPSVPASLDGFGLQVEQLLSVIQERMEFAETDNNEIYHDVIPADLRDIRGQLLVKAEKDIPETMTTPSVPLFRNLLKPPAKAAVQQYSKEMEGLVYQMSALVEEQTDKAKTQLARANLPHCLTAYKQEMSGGGIPQDLWDRVEAIQRDERVKQLKHDLWTLRDVADAARDTAQVINRQLDEDVEMDRLFREMYASFDGHSVQEVQREARATLQGYEGLLAKSQAGDSVLLKRLEVLDSDPKYQLLQFNKSKLDNLLPSRPGSVRPIDTTKLSQLLVDLSNLFEERESILKVLKEKVENYNIRSKLAEVDENSPSSDQQYQKVVREARNSVQSVAYDIQLNVDRQADLVESILDENARFMHARGSAGVRGKASDSAIAMIDDAIEDVEFFSKHLKEGHNFYSVVTPKLDQLKHQVDDISVRLTVERCDHEDEANHGTHRRKQAETDANMALNLAGGTNTQTGAAFAAAGGASNHGSSGHSFDPHFRQDGGKPSSAHPGVTSVSHNDVPQVRVDDEKVASLVAMDFDPDKVVDALKRYDNNVEMAINDLLQ